jgi:hypothetical protein
MLAADFHMPGLFALLVLELSISTSSLSQESPLKHCVPAFPRICKPWFNRQVVRDTHCSSLV